MKKLRTQPAFATLTDAEVEQLACMVQRETYAAVLERIRKPRSEGGFDLQISTSPLERLLDRKNKLDLINARLARESAEPGQLTQLTLAELNTITSGETHASPEVHQAILSATYDLVTSGDNTPHQLLALQRLADFPARAELREQTIALRAERQELARAKEQRAVAKELRDQSKAQRDQEMHQHKIEMDHLRKEATTERLKLTRDRLEITKLRLDLTRQRSHQEDDYSFDSDDTADEFSDFATPPPSSEMDENLPPRTPVERAGDEAPFNNSPTEALRAASTSTSGPAAARRPMAKNAPHSRTTAEPKFRFPGSPLPPEVIENNRRFAEKLIEGVANGTLKYTDDYVANRNNLKEFRTPPFLKAKLQASIAPNSALNQGNESIDSRAHHETQ